MSGFRAMALQAGGGVHPFVGCDGCQMNPLRGIRWKCSECDDYDLCRQCYEAGKHDLTHSFLKFETPLSSGVKTPARQSPGKSPSLTGVVAAQVVRGLLGVASRALDNKSELTHVRVGCDSCQVSPVRGIRWKCTVCNNYDLCMQCYETGKHNLTHSFLKIERPSTRGVKMPSRASSGSSQSLNASNMAQALHSLLSLEKDSQDEVTHPRAGCDGCQMNPVRGIRWKCTVCNNYDLCTQCYEAEKHDLTHSFLKIERPSTRGMKMPPRASSGSSQSLNASNMAKVLHSLPSLEKDSQDEVTHPRIWCDSCRGSPLRGIRWKCTVCNDYDLCMQCYEAGKHDLTHSFFKIERPSTRRVKMPPRTGSARPQPVQDSGCSSGKESGTIHKSVTCDDCKMKPLRGTRWKCSVCFNYDLCDHCYTTGNHKLTHSFLKIDTPSSAGVKMPQRVSSGNSQSQKGNAEAKGALRPDFGMANQYVEDDIDDDEDEDEDDEDEEDGACASEDSKDSDLPMGLDFEMLVKNLFDVKVTPNAVKLLDCAYYKMCAVYMKTLNIDEVFLETTGDLCYCMNCHISRGDKSSFKRGVPPRKYCAPVGWARFGIKVPVRAQALDAFRKWHRTYHGTKPQAIQDILSHGQLLMPGSKTMSGKKLNTRPGHFDENYGPKGFNFQQLFFSPSIRYSGHNAYATPTSYTEPRSNQKFIAKTVLQVLIGPDSYTIGPQTVGATGLIDPGFTNEELEWMTDHIGSSIIYGLLIKLES